MKRPRLCLRAKSSSTIKKTSSIEPKGGQHSFFMAIWFFSKGFTRLEIDFRDGRKASVAGKARLVRGFSSFSLERDLLQFGAETTWTDENGNFGAEDAIISLSGHVSPEDGQLKFFGSYQGNETFNVALAGRYKVVAGGIQIESDEQGNIGVNLELKGDLKFRGATGQFGISLGYSDSKDLSIQAAIRFESDRTSEDGLTRLQGGAFILIEDGKIEAELDLQGTFKMRQNRVLVFELEAGLSDSKLELALKGTLLISKGKEVSFQVGYANSQASIKLALKTEKLQAMIELASGDSGFSASFSVTYNFGAEDDEESKPGIPEHLPESTTEALAATSDASIGALPATHASVAVSQPDISPATFPQYPRTSTGCSNDFLLLHPVMRRLVAKLQTRIYSEGIPLFVFEGFRSPDRQNKLFEKVPRVTKARAWQSYHQYGVAVDFVFHENGNWHWGRNERHKTWYKTLHRYALEIGLERLSWETPHLQIAGLTIEDLRAGRYPSAGDSSWGTHLANVIDAWSGKGGAPAAPPAPADFVDCERPPLDILSAGPTGEGRKRRLMQPADLDDASAFHSRNNGIEWKVDVVGEPKGVLVKGRQLPERTHGEPVTCRKIFSLYGDLITRAALLHDVPEELIVMTIATETAMYRDVAFSGLKTFRWEPRIGEYSAGPMQTLSSTVRELIEHYDLPYRPEEVAPHYADKPKPVPAAHPLYDPELNLELGTLEIKHRLGSTGFDPILVAAAYNAGGLYATEGNRWRLRSYGDHLDRAARWFGDVFAV